MSDDRPEPVEKGDSPPPLPLAGRISRPTPTKANWVIPVLAGVMLLGVFLFFFIPNFLVSKHQQPVNTAASALKNLANVQEDYFVQHDTYSADLSVLVGEYGNFHDENVTIVILAADSDSWSATATFLPSGRTYTYTSSEGGLQ